MGNRSGADRTAQRQVASKICYLLAVYCQEKNQLQDALGYGQQALKYNEGDHVSRLTLAKIYLLTDQMELAQKQVCLDKTNNL